jgi:lysophospholipase L1-like esterase
MEASPNTGTLINSGYTTDSPRLDYEIDFVETGTHYVWIRGLGDSDGASKNDSMHVGLDGLAVSTADRITNFNSSWTWTNTAMGTDPVARIDVTTPGTHTLNLYMREDGLIVDKIVLTTDPGLDPAAFGPNGPAQTPRGTRAPVLSPLSGTFSDSLVVSITTGSGAEIRYTTDGSEPTVSSPIYVSPIGLSNDATIKAIAIDSESVTSQVSTGIYTKTACVDTRIMPLGDSITLGKNTSNLPEVGLRYGYRRPLYFSLVEAGYNVDMVGDLNEAENVVPVFDTDHEGHAGITDQGLAQITYSLLESNPPDIVLLYIGTNGLASDAADVADILDEIDRFDPSIHVVLAKIINWKTYNPLVTEFNANVEAMALARIASGDKITIVDMENALSYPDDMQDSVHPKDSGYLKMSDVWFNALDSLIPACAQ